MNNNIRTCNNKYILYHSYLVVELFHKLNINLTQTKQGEEEEDKLNKITHNSP